MKSVEIGQFFQTLDAEEGPDEMNNLCKEKKQASESNCCTRMDCRWYENQTSLVCKKCRHQDRCGIEMLVESWFRDGTASWVLSS